jgi:hypothetical protein
MKKTDRYYCSKLTLQDHLAKLNQPKYEGDIVDLMEHAKVINLKVQQNKIIW